MEAFNEFNITVHAIDTRRGVEGKKFGTINVSNPAPSMGQISSMPWMGGGCFTWPTNKESDFLYYRIKSYLVDGSGVSDHISYVEQTSSTYIRNLDTQQKEEGFQQIVIEIVAIDTFGNESLMSKSDLVVDSLNIKPTDINDFALSASRMFSTAIALEGELFYSNSTDCGKTQSAGFISWNAHKLFIRGVEFQINAGSTDKKYIYFKTSRKTYPTAADLTDASSHPVEYSIAYESSAIHPADAGLIELNFDRGKYGQIIAVNSGGYYDLAWNAVANQVIGSAYIMNGAINDAHIGTLSARKITAGSAFVGGVSIGGMTTLDVSLGPVGELPQVPTYLPEGLYITRDFIGYYLGPRISGGSIIKNGSGVISLAKGSKIVTGSGTKFMDYKNLGLGLHFRMSIPVINEGATSSELVSFEFRSEDIVSDTLLYIDQTANYSIHLSPIEYSGRYVVMSRDSYVEASNLWAYVFKSDGTVAVQEGGQIVIGNKNIVMDTKDDVNSIIIAPDGGKFNTSGVGQNYIEMRNGDVKEYFWNGTAHVQMKALKNIVVGTCTSGVDCTITGNFKAPGSGVVAPTVMIMAPESMVSDPNQIHVPFKIVSDPGTVTYVSGTLWKFNPKIGIEYSGGVWAHKGPTGCAYTTGIPATVTTLRDLTNSIVCPKNTTQVILEFSAQSNMNTDLLGVQSGRFSLKYQKNDDTWVNNGAYLDVNMSNLAINDYGISVSDGDGIKNVVLSFTPFSNTVDIQLRGDVSTLSTYVNAPYFFENSAQAKYIAFGSNS